MTRTRQHTSRQQISRLARTAQLTHTVTQITGSLRTAHGVDCDANAYSSIRRPRAAWE